MLSFTPYILMASLVLSFTQASLMPSNTDTALWTQLCSGRMIRLDLGENDIPPQQPTHNKACHAVCCQKEGEGASESESET